MSKKNVLKNIGWLTAGLLVAKMFGGLYKLLLIRILGGENIGIYQQILPLYSFLIILITSGVPLAVSKLLATKEDDDSKLKAFSNSLVLFLSASLALSFFLILFAKKIASVQGNENLTICYFLIAPCLVFSALSAVFKGYFQGQNEFTPSAISQIAEQIAKIVFGLGLAWILSRFGTTLQIVGAVIGISIADLVNFIVLLVLFKKRKLKFKKIEFNKNEIKELVGTILPIMLTSLVIPFSQMVDSFLVVKLLNRNFIDGASKYLYGLQSGIVATLVNIPSVLTFSISTVLLPKLAQDFKNGENVEFRKKVSLVVKFLLLIALPCCLFILFYPNQFISLIYKGKLDGFNIDGEMLSTKLLLFSAFNVIFLCLSQFFSIVLQAREKKYLPAVNNLIGMVVKTLLIVIFVPSRQLNIMAFTIASSVGYFVIFILNYLEVVKEQVLKIRYNYWVKLGISNLIVILFSTTLLAINSNSFSFVLVTFSSILIYMMCVWFLKPFNKSEINKLIKNN